MIFYIFNKVMKWSSFISVALYGKEIKSFIVLNNESSKMYHMEKLFDAFKF